ncbi:MAG: aminomethyltransferase family protein [Gammaproteobacteria bacterium]|nr:aminomethyltransferase family protein [Gammaproteobacteria bacterium]MDH3468593.1 aminomethyltransferase family protein [Gammaproteobacteria bacterium]
MQRFLKAIGAEFAVVNGWERATFFKPYPTFKQEHSYCFPNWNGVVAKEVKSLCSGVGIAEISGFNRYEFSGKGARDWLNSLTCSRTPERPGKVGLSYFLTEKGNVCGEATLAIIEEDRIWYGSAAAAEYHDMDWLSERLPEDGAIAIKSLTNDYTTLVLAGPQSRALLQTVSPRTDWTEQGFPSMSVRRSFIGHSAAIAMSVSFSGELAFELHVPNDQLLSAYELLVSAGKEFHLSHFGMYAAESMRIEKGYGHWKADLITEYNPVEAGLERCVDMRKSFPGQAGLQAQLRSGLRKNRVLIAIDSDRAPAQSGESVFDGKTVVGTITSGAWGYRIARNIAMAYIDPEYAAVGTRLEVSLLGRCVRVDVCGVCLYDLEITAMRNSVWK